MRNTATGAAAARAHLDRVSHARIVAPKCTASMLTDEARGHISIWLPVQEPKAVHINLAQSTSDSIGCRHIVAFDRCQKLMTCHYVITRRQAKKPKILEVLSFVAVFGERAHTLQCNECTPIRRESQRMAHTPKCKNEVVPND